MLNNDIAKEQEQENKKKDMQGQTENILLNAVQWCREKKIRKLPLVENHFTFCLTIVAFVKDNTSCDSELQDKA